MDTERHRTGGGPGRSRHAPSGNPRDWERAPRLNRRLESSRRGGTLQRHTVSPGLSGTPWWTFMTARSSSLSTTYHGEAAMSVWIVIVSLARECSSQWMTDWGSISDSFHDRSGSSRRALNRD
jgi:hypothetical protein